MAISPDGNGWLRRMKTPRMNGQDGSSKLSFPPLGQSGGNSDAPMHVVSRVANAFAHRSSNTAYESGATVAGSVRHITGFYALD